jgi:hypothetical protein
MPSEESPWFVCTASLDSRKNGLVAMPLRWPEREPVLIPSMTIPPAFLLNLKSLMLDYRASINVNASSRVASRWFVFPTSNVKER